jgi:phage I-like protein
MKSKPLDERTLVSVFQLDAALPEGDAPRSWIQVMVAGEFDHGRYGKFSITEKDLQGFASDIEARADRIPIDFDHDSADGSTKAAGWYTGETRLEADAQGRPALFAEVEWTPLGADAIRTKTYRYISPEFAKKWRNALGKVVNAHRMFATALTNRPFLDGMAPVQLSDTGGDHAASDDQEVTMELKDIALSLNLAEDADADAIKAALEAKNAETTKLSEEVEKLKSDLAAAYATDDETMKKLAESAAKGELALKKLHDVERDSLLAGAVEKGKILPAQTETASRSSTTSTPSPRRRLSTRCPSARSSRRAAATTPSWSSPRSRTGSSTSTSPATSRSRSRASGSTRRLACC